METQVGLYFKKISEKLERQANCRRAQRDITFSQGKILWYLHRCEDEPVTLSWLSLFSKVKGAIWEIWARNVRPSF